VLSTPPAFVLSQNQTLQTKTTHPKKRQVEFESEQSDLTKRHQKLASKTKTTQARQEDEESPHKDGNKKQQTKPPNTLLSSQTTDFMFSLPVSGQPIQLNLSEPG
jgi:hypothetical protein